MPRPTWQKSSFSTGGEGNCVELATAVPATRVHLRESDRPCEIATAAPRALSWFLLAIKSGAIDSGSR